MTTGMSIGVISLKPKRQNEYNQCHKSRNKDYCSACTATPATRADNHVWADDYSRV